MTTPHVQVGSRSNLIPRADDSGRVPVGDLNGRAVRPAGVIPRDDERIPRVPRSDIPDDPRSMPRREIPRNGPVVPPVPQVTVPPVPIPREGSRRGSGHVIPGSANREPSFWERFFTRRRYASVVVLRDNDGPRSSGIIRDNDGPRSSGIKGILIAAALAVAALVLFVLLPGTRSRIV